jgi:hypothetical protein
VHLLLSHYISTAVFHWRLLVQLLSIRFSLSLWCFCVTAVSRYFYHRLINWYDCYLSSIGYCRYNPFVLSYIDYAESMYRKDTHDLRVLTIGWSKPILVVYHVGYGRSILSFPISISAHLYQPIYRLRDRLYIYRPYTLNHTPIGYTSLNCCADVIESI